MPKGKIIFLNGVSSSGKTTLAKALQANLSEPFYLLSYDMFCDMSPEKFLKTNAKRTTQTIKTGLHHAIKLFADIGINTIVDHVILKGEGVNSNITNSEDIEECVYLLHEYDIIFVRVVCPLNKLRRREKERGNRAAGTAEYQLPQLNPQDIYDITVDTHNNSIEECADKIIELLNCPEKSTAFKTLWLQRAL